MDDLISRSAALDALEWKWAGKAAMDAIKNLPSAQQEIIRCKDCKWYEIYQLKKDGTDDRRYKPSYCTLLRHNFKPDWFCADGERREDGC